MARASSKAPAKAPAKAPSKAPDKALHTPRRGEARLPAAVAVLAGAALYGALPNTLVPWSRLLVPALEVVLLVPLIAINPTRFTRETRASRVLSLLLVLVIATANLTSLGYLVHALVGKGISDGPALLRASLQIWLTNILAFGLAFWELDRGGPVARTQQPRDALPAADFRFSQDENHGAVSEVAQGSSVNAGWVPSLIDYVYVSVTNSTAFSPTDTMPLTTRAKCLMAVESVSALVLSVLVIARGVSLLN